ncbi:hypothetical protein CAI16_18965 [Virgibacillus dokdonensis]|uniref:Uncharacterized protein n=1 Tax=Virgibacillus dokdonensis TaxID=302167 RepID=A0A3E0WJS1_9BACI|nr:permease prefix domain 1-containing protein [Virgibacillus dokdonensis]RFA32135.1 hypothetical protein CAI16_18965 [Virgibacillus dokdonensis]
MREVEEYVDKLYKHANPNYPETKELKEETRIHLNESIKELMKDGYSENDSFRIAVERFGGIEQAEKLISLMHIRQKSFAMWLLRVGVLSLLSASILLIFLLYLGNVHDAEFAEIGYTIGEDSSSSTDLDVAKYLSKEPFVLKASLYNDESDHSNPDLTFQGGNQWVPSLFKSVFFYGTDRTFISLEIIDIRTIGIFLFAIGFTIYYVLFTIWGLIQLYHRGELKLVWIIGLVVLNVVGYIIFSLKDKKNFTERF